MPQHLRQILSVFIQHLVEHHAVRTSGGRLDELFVAQQAAMGLLNVALVALRRHVLSAHSTLAVTSSDSVHRQLATKLHSTDTGRSAGTPAHHPDPARAFEHRQARPSSSSCCFFHCLQKTPGSKCAMKAQSAAWPRAIQEHTRAYEQVVCFCAQQQAGHDLGLSRPVKTRNEQVATGTLFQVVLPKKG
jgi:hypothetical protein